MKKFKQFILGERFTPVQLKALKKAFIKVKRTEKRIDPDSQVIQSIAELIKGLKDIDLEKLKAEKIPFVSALATTELVRRKFDGESDNIDEAVTYDDILNKLSYAGTITSNVDKLFSDNTYAWHPPIDLDKLINYSSYYWLGEIYLLKQEHREAALTFAEGYQKFPKVNMSFPDWAPNSEGPHRLHRDEIIVENY